METTGQRRAAAVVATVMALLVLAGVGLATGMVGSDCDQEKAVPTFPSPAEHLCGGAAKAANGVLGKDGDKYLVGKPSIDGQTVTVVAAAYSDGTVRLAALDDVFRGAEPFSPGQGFSVRRTRDPRSGATLIYGSAPLAAVRVESGRDRTDVRRISAPTVMLRRREPALFALLVPAENADMAISARDSHGANVADDPPLVSR